MRIVLAMSLWLSLAAGNLLGQQVTLSVPEAVFYNGKIVTVDSVFSIHEAFAVKGEQFLAVGSNAKMRALAGPGTHLIDLRGSTVIPGLIDSSNQQYWAAFNLFAGVKVDMQGAGTVGEMLNRIRQALASAKPAQGLFTVEVGFWDESEVAEKRGPTRQELDQISPDRPLMVATLGPASHVTQSKAFVNTAALKAAGIGRETKSLNGYAIPKDSNGEPTGMIGNRGTILGVYVILASEEDKKKLILNMQQEQHALGLTSIRVLGQFPGVMRVYGSVWREGKLTMRVSMGLDIAPAEADKVEEILKAWGVGAGFGDHWLRLDGAGPFPVLDGDGVQAYLREPPLEPYPTKYVFPQIPIERFRQAMFAMNRYGWRPAIRVAGDQSLDIALDAFEAADGQSSIRDKRWIVNGIPVVHPDQMERMARLGVMVSANALPYDQSSPMIRYWGKERAQRAVPMRELLDHHLIVSTGSDPVWNPDDLFLNIYFYVTRKTEDGQPLGSEQKISREEALRVCTINNAYMTHEEKVKGSIEAGKLADFLILSKDILNVPEEQIRSIRPVATYVGGREVFSTKDGGF